MNTRAEMTDYINSLVGQEMIYGENDCNMVCLKITDILKGTDYYDKMYQKYTDIKSGFTQSKKLIKFGSGEQFFDEHYKITDIVDDGCFVVMVREEGKRKVFHCSVVISGYALTVGDDNKYKTVPVCSVPFDTLYKIKD